MQDGREYIPLEGDEKETRDIRGIDKEWMREMRRREEGEAREQFAE